MGEDRHVLATSLPRRSPSAAKERLKEVFVALEGVRDQFDMKTVQLACLKLKIYVNLKGAITGDERRSLILLLLSLLDLPELSLLDETKILKNIRDLLNIGERINVTIEWRSLWKLVEKHHLKETLDLENNASSKNVRSRHGQILREVCLLSRRYFDEAAVDQVAEASLAMMQDPLSLEIFTGQTMLGLMIPAVNSDRFAKHFVTWLRIWEAVEDDLDWSSAWLRIFHHALKWGGGHRMLSTEQHRHLQRHIITNQIMSASHKSFRNNSGRARRPEHLDQFVCKVHSRFKYAAKVSVALLGAGKAEDFYAPFYKGGEEALKSILGNDGEGLTRTTEEELRECVEQDKELSSGLLHLRRVLIATSTLLHPSNLSSQSAQIAMYVEGLCTSFCKRLGRERAAKLSPQERLSHQDKRALVLELLPLLQMCTYSKSRSVGGSGCAALAQLAYVAPITVANHILPGIAQALDPSNLSMTHQGPSAIRTLTHLVQPLLQARPLLAETLPGLLELTLPGIDPNDVQKTIATTTLYQVVLSWIPIVDTLKLEYPTETQVRAAMSEKDRDLFGPMSESYGVDDPAEEMICADTAPMRNLMWSAAPALVDWSMRCVDRLLILIDSLGARAKRGVDAAQDSMLLSNFTVMARLLLGQMSASVLIRAGDRLNQWALSGNAKVEGYKECKAILRCYAVSCVGALDDKQLRATLLKGLFEPMLERATSKDSSQTKREWALLVLGSVSRVTGPYMLEYEQPLRKCIDTALADEEASVRKVGGKLLRRLIRGLSEEFVPSRASISALDRAESPADAAAKSKALAVAAVSWAQPGQWRNSCADVQWHLPSAEEIALAERLKEAYLGSTLRTLAEMERDSSTKKTDGGNNGRGSMRAQLELLFQVLRGVANLPSTDRKERQVLSVRLCKLGAWLVTHRESDTASQKRVLRCAKIVLACYGSKATYPAQLTTVRQVYFEYIRVMLCSRAFEVEAKETLGGSVWDRDYWVAPRFHMLDSVQTLNLQQNVERCFEEAQETKDLGDEQSLQDCFDFLQVCNSHDWAETRAAAQVVLRSVMTKAPWFGKAMVPALINRFAEPDGEFGRIIGASQLLSWTKVTRWVISSWELLDLFARRVLLQPHALYEQLPEDKRRKIQEARQSLTSFVLRHWGGISVASMESQEARAGLLRDLGDPAFTQDLGWRQQMIVCVVMMALALPEGQDKLVSPEILSWLLQRAANETAILPLRVCSLSVFVQLLGKVEDKRKATTIRQLHLDDHFPDLFRSLADTLASSIEDAAPADGSATKGKDWSDAVADILSIASFPSGRRSLRRSIWRKRGRVFSPARFHLVEQLAVVLGPAKCLQQLTPIVRSYLLENTHTAEHAGKVAAAAEIFAGLASAAKTSLHDDIENFAASELAQLAMRKVGESTLQSASVWHEAYRSVECRETRLALLEDYVSRACIALSSHNDMSAAMEATNLLQVARFMLCELKEVPEDAVALMRRVVEACVQATGHRFGNVRQEVAKMMSAVADMCEFRQVAGRYDWIPEAFATVITAGQADLDKDRKSLEEVPAEGAAASPASDATTMAQAGAGESSDTAANCTETALYLCSFVAANRGLSRDQYLASFASLVTCAQGHRKIEVGSLARAAAGTMAASAFSTPEAATGMLGAICSGMKETSDSNWHAREMLSRSLGILLMANDSMLGYAVGAVHLRKEVEKLLRDTQPEVSETASAVLTRIYSSFSPKSASLVVSKDRYLKLAKTKMSSNEAKTEEGKEKLRKRLTGVLGLTALVHAFPYTVPFPDAVVAIAKRCNDPNPVGTRAKKAVQMFKHTHSDSWKEAKAHFTADELEDLQDSSFSGSHS